MAYALGIALFALAILVSVCLHEAGHMITAKSFGMKVTKYLTPRAFRSSNARPRRRISRSLSNEMGPYSPGRIALLLE